VSGVRAAYHFPLSAFHSFETVSTFVGCDLLGVNGTHEGIIIALAHMALKSTSLIMDKPFRLCT
jgi:hypothetical protein